MSKPHSPSDVAEEHHHSWIMGPGRYVICERCRISQQEDRPKCGCYPHGPREPCTCDGCWACTGHVLGCTCDIAWDCEHLNAQVAALAQGADERRKVPGVPDDLDALRRRQTATEGGNP